MINPCGYDVTQIFIRNYDPKKSNLKVAKIYCQFRPWIAGVMGYWSVEKKISIL
jgi:hypothetical protein